MVSKSARPIKFRKIAPYLLAGAIGILGAYWSNDHFRKQPLTYENISAIQGVEAVSQMQGKPPEIIVILQNHVVQTEKEEGIYKRGSRQDSIKPISQICGRLYQKFGVRTLLPEGLDPGLREVYKKNGKIKFQKKDSTGYVQTLEDLINSYKWDLEFAEDSSNHEELKKLLAPVYKIHSKYLDANSVQVKQIQERVSTSGDILAEVSLKNRLNSVVDQTNKKIKEEVDAYFNPERMNLLYKLVIENRDQAYADACTRAKKENKLPLILIIGAAHKDTLPEKLKGLDYVIVRPPGIADIKPITQESLKERYYLKISIQE